VCLVRVSGTCVCTCVWYVYFRNVIVWSVIASYKILHYNITLINIKSGFGGLVMEHSLSVPKVGDLIYVMVLRCASTLKPGMSLD